MSIELKMLAWAIGLGILHLVLAAGLSTHQRGMSWNVGARDNPVTPLTGVAGRVDRAFRNFLETFAFFAAAVLALVFAQQGNAESAMGAQIYFWARVVYLPVYAAGIPYLRSLIWTASLVGLIMVLKPLI